MSLIDLLQASVHRVPNQVALVHGARRIDYATLWERIGSASELLAAHGIGPGARVGLLLDNSPEYVASYYAVLALNAVAVPLNPAARALDLAGVLEHAGATLLVAHTEHPELAALQTVAPQLPILDAADLLDAPPAAVPARDIPHDSPATIIYTSGTTGRPKGVTLSHRNLVANAQSILAYLKLGSDDVIVNVLPFHYSYGNSVLHTHLAAGGRLVLDRTLVFPHAVLDAMVAEKATGFSGVPSSFGVLLARTHLEQYDLRALRYVTQAGGAMPPAQINELMLRLPHVRLYVMYGQTEATARLTWLPPEQLESKLGSVGIPIPGVEISIRDEQGDVLPDGDTGEIWARGDNVMMGYWNDAAATRCVIDDGWLKTGDLAHRDRDGYIFIDGRRSEMIKCGAHRISPAEVEEVISGLEDVEEVACTGAPDALLGQVVKAVIVPRAGAVIEPRQVQRHCRERLPHYKVPRVIEFADALPRTASGKVQRLLLQGTCESKGERDVSGTGNTRTTAARDR